MDNESDQMYSERTEPHSGELGAALPPAIESPPLAIISGLPLDILRTGVRFSPGGAKHAAKFTVRLGGAGPNMARAAKAAGAKSAVIGVQAPSLIQLAQMVLRRMGAMPLVSLRPNAEPALSLGLPRDEDGAHWDLYSQRLPIQSADLRRAEIQQVIENARVTVVGPTAATDVDAWRWMRMVARKSRFAVLVPHLDALADAPRFARVARAFDHIHMNAAEARRLFPDLSAREAALTAVLAVRLRHFLGDEIGFTLTNGSQSGLAWLRDDGGVFHWHNINPLPVVKPVCDVGAGDCWLATFLVARQIQGRACPDSLDFACAASASWIAKPIDQPERPSAEIRRAA